MEKTITLSLKEYEDLKATEASNQKIIEELQAIKSTQLYEELSAQVTIMELHIKAINSIQLYEELSVQVTIMELHIKALKSRNLWQRIFNTPVSLTVLNNALKPK